MTDVAWIGTGVMGRAMCGHLLDAGHRLRVFSRTRERAQELVDRGAEWRASPREAAADAEVVCVMVGTPDDVREVTLGPEGALDAMANGTFLVDLTTSSPDLAAEISQAAKARGVEAIDAPVSGGDVGARRGQLVVMAGGEAEAIEAVRPLLECFSSVVDHHGPPGAGQHTKMVNQILISSNMIAVCEGLLYGYKAGLDLETVFKSVSVGAAGSKALEVLGPRMLKRDFEPGFYVEHFIKDMGIALAEAEKMNLCLPGLALAKQLYEAVRAQGYGRKGTQALLLALETINNAKR
jgi:3-hydroxyisobutyrate dehydrogenase